ncbi:NYN domain-containing protein [Pararobbsia alpina]|uniref:HTH OST-type domain-containing protein n=1 Tax=Pararobbsia alpina TaxID=621374 RepID=A0A6S7BBL9_9BURK|nr:NYN domain-containing protein [Pararobbsia alpina]CAB3785673.1 hypothetical protein LMG28138_02035 [Pararobbsia alpina]
MATSNENVSMALFCDFENVALGVRDAKYEKFDIKPVLERLLLKGSIVVKKAYCDWERYKGFKASMHEANFELIEIPHVRRSGKNSADIRLVVDALDLCYTKSHVDTFVIISGDSDFSPLVSKLRENAKRVIGVGVKQSTSDLLVANCDEFIFYDDLVRESQRQAAKRDKREPQPALERSSDEVRSRKDELEARKVKAIEIAVETFDALVSEQGDGGKIWASVLKDAIKRRKPDFSESYYGFRAFGNLLEEARARGLLDVGRDEKSGTFVFRGHEGVVSSEVAPRRGASVSQENGETQGEAAGDPPETRAEPRRKGRGSRRGGKAGDASRGEGVERPGGRGQRHPDLFAGSEVSTLQPSVPQDGGEPAYERPDERGDEPTFASTSESAAGSPAGSSSRPPLESRPLPESSSGFEPEFSSRSPSGSTADATPDPFFERPSRRNRAEESVQSIFAEDLGRSGSAEASAEQADQPEARRRPRGTRRPAAAKTARSSAPVQTGDVEAAGTSSREVEARAVSETVAPMAAKPASGKAREGRAARKRGEAKPADIAIPDTVKPAEEAKKPAARPRRPRKPAATPAEG